MVGGHQHLVTLLQPGLQVVGQEDVSAAGAVAILAAVQTVAVTGVIDVHRMHQQKVWCVAAAQVLGVGEQV
ncbi:hypothetical protein D3C79_799510 [compost metagenome]